MPSNQMFTKCVFISNNKNQRLYEVILLYFIFSSIKYAESQVHDEAVHSKGNQFTILVQHEPKNFIDWKRKVNVVERAYITKYVLSKCNK